MHKVTANLTNFVVDSERIHTQNAWLTISIVTVGCATDCSEYLSSQEGEWKTKETSGCANLPDSHKKKAIAYS